MQRLRFVGMLVLSVGLMGLTLACQREAPDTRAADEQAIRAVDVECLKAVQAKELEGWLSCWADDATALPPNAPIGTGKEAIRAVWSQTFANPGFAASWQTTTVEASRASDLAYTLFTYELTLNDPEGKPVTDRGKGVAVWKKQPDGSWKIGAGIWNSDAPPPATQ